MFIIIFNLQKLKSIYKGKRQHQPPTSRACSLQNLTIWLCSLTHSLTHYRFRLDDHFPMATIAFGSGLVSVRSEQTDAFRSSLLYTQNFNFLRLKRSCASSMTRWRGVGVPRATAEAVGGRVIDRGEEVEEKEKGSVLRVGVVCGGPSAERGISLNSARSVLDHIQVRVSSL